MTTEQTGPLPFARQVAKNIRVHAVLKEVNMTDVAAGVDLDRASLYKRFAGDVDWRYSELLAVARYFGVPLADIAPEHLEASLEAGSEQEAAEA